MGLLDRLLRRGEAHEARKAELRGDLVRALELWAQTGENAEVARVMLLRGAGEPDPRQRLQYVVQAVAAAPAGSPIAAKARVERAALTVALASDGAVSATTRRDLLEAARELEELGEADRAAEAYALVRDTEGQARALVQAGQVERLENLLTSEHEKASEEHRRARAYGEIEALVADGRRREALAAAARLAADRPLDRTARECVQAIEARRVGAGPFRVLFEGRPLSLVLDDELVVGRVEGSVLVSSAALSRRHLAITRVQAEALARDLGSRNGTLLAGQRLAGAIPVGAGLVLMLGGEVRLEVKPSASLGGAFDVDLGGSRYVASLGPLPIGHRGWRLEKAADGWVELVTGDASPAFRGELATARRTTLLVGDRLSGERGGPAILELL